MTAYLEYEGAPVPAQDLVWFTKAPCGCYSGVMTTDAGDNGTLIATVEQAWDNDMSPKPVRRLRRAQGFEYELGRRADVVTRLRGECPHTPAWGVEKTPTPAGHHWAVTGTRARNVHLVPGEPDDRHRITADFWMPGNEIPALCGAKQYGWDAWPGARHDYLECGKCAAAAKAQAAA